MKKNFQVIQLFTIVLLGKIFFSCATVQKEVDVKSIPLSGIINDRNQEISGMDWYKNNLILLPENLNGYLFSIPKSDLHLRIRSIDTTSIEPEKISFNTPNYKETLPGFDSFEAIAFRGDEVYIAIEIRYPDSMATLLARGHVNPLTKEVVLPEQNLVHLPVPKFVDNMSYESLLINKTDIFAFFESNGRNLVDSAYALSYSLKSKFVKSIALPSIEYRITDVTKIENNKFWAINYFFPRDSVSLKPSRDLLAQRFGEGESHFRSKRVERLVEFELKEGAFNLSKQAPVQLVLDGDKTSRKWEALSRYDNEGFLLATDKYPKTMLVFVPFKK